MCRHKVPWRHFCTIDFIWFIFQSHVCCTFFHVPRLKWPGHWFPFTLGRVPIISLQKASSNLSPPHVSKWWFKVCVGWCTGIWKAKLIYLMNVLEHSQVLLRTYKKILYPWVLRYSLTLETVTWPRSVNTSISNSSIFFFCWLTYELFLRHCWGNFSLVGLELLI